MEALNFQSLTVKEKKALAEARDESRKVTKREFMTQRLDEAQHLLGNILTDKPDLPIHLPARVTTPKSRPTKDRSPIRTLQMKARSPVRKRQGILKTRDVSPPYMSEYDMNMEGYDQLDLEEDWPVEPEFDQSEPRKIVVQSIPDRGQVQPRQITVQPAREPIKGKKSAGLVPRLKLSLEDVDEEEPLKLQQTADTTGEREILNVY